MANKVNDNMEELNKKYQALFVTMLEEKGFTVEQYLKLAAKGKVDCKTELFEGDLGRKKKETFYIRKYLFKRKLGCIVTNTELVKTSDKLTEMKATVKFEK